MTCKEDKEGQHFTMTATIDGEIRKVCLNCGERID